MTTSAPLEPPPPCEDAPRHQAPPSVNRGPPRGPPPPRPLLNLPALNVLRGKRIVLASQSPRRRQLLAQLGLVNLDIVPSDFAEDLPKSMSPFEYVLETASEKARSVYKQEIDNAGKPELGIVIAADTIIISKNGRILEKPRNEVDHIKMLQMLRDEQIHKVATAVAVMAPNETAVDPGYNMETHIEETTVKFDSSVTNELILAYVKTRDGADKAGGYGLQTAGSILIERIEGSYDNVIGLPLRPTLRLIEKVMIPEQDDEGGVFLDEEESDE